MASLYIKDSETAERVDRMAQHLGATKTEVVRRAMTALEEKSGLEAPRRDLLTWIEEYRRENPLPPPTGLKADKAFFDELWGED